MSKWRFQGMTDDDARTILASGDWSTDTLADRIKAHRLLARCYSDSGWSPPPLRYFERCERCLATGNYNRYPCSLCGGRGFTESERPR